MLILEQVEVEGVQKDGLVEDDFPSEHLPSLKRTIRVVSGYWNAGYLIGTECTYQQTETWLLLG